MDDSPPPAPRSIPPGLFAAFASDGDESVFGSAVLSSDDVFTFGNTLQEHSPPDLPTGPPPALPGETLQSREESPFGPPYNNSHSPERRGIIPEFSSSDERESLLEGSPQMQYDASLPIGEMPTMGPPLHHFTKDRPKRTVSKPSRDKLRSASSQDDSVDELAVIQTNRGPSSVSVPSSSKLTNERDAANEVEITALPANDVSSLSLPDGHSIESNKESGFVDSSKINKEPAVVGATDLFHQDLSVELATNISASLSGGSKASPSLVDIVQKVRPSLATHQKVTPTSFSSRLKNIRRNRGSRLSTGVLSSDSSARSPVLSRFVSSPFLHSGASTSSLGSETPPLSTTSAGSCAEEPPTTQDKTRVDVETREESQLASTDSLHAYDSLDFPQVFLQPVVPGNVSSTVNATLGNSLLPDSPPLSSSPPVSLSPDQPPLVDSSLVPVQVVNVDEVEWSTLPSSLRTSDAGDGSKISEGLVQSSLFSQDIYESNNHEFDQPPAEPEAPPPPISPLSLPPLPSESFEEQLQPLTEMTTASQASEQSSHLSPINMDLSSELSSTLPTLSDDKLPSMDSVQYIPSESKERNRVDSHKRTERSRSVYSDTTENIVLKPNLKRWDVTDLDKISNTSGSSDPLQENLVVHLVGQSRELRSTKSAMDFTLRPRSSSGLSWVSAETADRSLESIIEVDPNTPLTDFPEPVGKQRPSTARTQRQGASYLMEDELSSSASTGNITHSHKHLSGRPLEGSFEHVHSNSRQGSVSSTISFQSKKRLPMIGMPMVSDSDPTFNHHPNMEDDISTLQDDSEMNRGNVNMLTENIPKSMSSLLEAVVSDLPSLADSSALVQDARADTLAPKIATVDPVPTAVTSQAAWSEDTPTSDTPIVGAGIEETDLALPRFKLQHAQKNPESSLSAEELLASVATIAMPAAVTTVTGASVTKPSVVQFAHGGITANSTVQEPTSSHNTSTQILLPSSLSSPVGKSPSQVGRDTVKKQSSGRTKVLKLYIRGVHPGIQYKAFKVTSLTTSRQLISEALEKCNLVQDTNLFAIYEVHDNGEPVRILKMDEPPLDAYRQAERRDGQEDAVPTTRLEMRRTTEKGKEMMVNVTLPDKPHRVVNLKLSDATLACQLVELALRKADLWDDTGPWTEPYCLLTKELHEPHDQANYLLQPEMVITSQYPEGSSFQLVDMLSYLPAVAEARERRTSVITMVNHEEVHDINAARIIIGKCQKLIQSMEKELVISDYNIEQLRKDLQESKAISEQLGAYQKTIETMDSAFKEQQQSASQTIKSLQAKITRLTNENESKEQLVLSLKSSRSRMVSSYSLSSNDEQFRSLERSLEAHQKTIEEINKEHADLLKRLEVQELENDSLKVENNRLRMVLEEKNFIDAFDCRNENNPLIRPTLFALMANQPMQAVIPVEVTPTDQGLGVKLSKDYGGKGGCIVEAVAEYSSARSLLTPGDRLLEVNGLDVTSLTPRAVSDLLQQRPSLVQMVVSRLIPLGGGPDSASGSDTDFRSSYEELRRDNKSLSLQLSQQNSATSNWRELHDKIKEELWQNSNKMAELEEVLHQRSLRMEELEGYCEKYRQQLAEEQNRKITDLQGLREMVVASHPVSPSDKESESLADTLSDASPSELMDALRTVESECLQNKEYLNQLLAVVVEHCPHLLGIMANIQSEEKGEAEHAMVTEDPREEEDSDTGWC